MKQTFTKESIELLDDEITIRNENGIAKYTTHPRARSGKLDRKAFVKPVDVEALAKEYAASQGDNARNYAVAHDWICGRNSNPNEFTREDMIQAVKYGAAYADAHGLGTLDLQEEAEHFIDSILPLSVPASVTIENNQVIESETIWD